MKQVFRLADLFGSFLADGELGNRLRFTEVEAALSQGRDVVFDFGGVTNLTDSFANGLFADLVLEHPADFAERVEFVHCSAVVRSIVGAALARGFRKAEQISQ